MKEGITLMTEEKRNLINELSAMIANATDEQLLVMWGAAFGFSASGQKC